MAAKHVPVGALVLSLTFLLLGNNVVDAQLRQGFYSSSCPVLLRTVRTVMQTAVLRETRMAASILRLFFLDCFVNGCDGSILLDDTPTFTGEKNAAPNRNSRGFEVIDEIKSAVELVCPGVVSCADILAIAARDAVVLVGGPSWAVILGRRDTRTASQAAATSSIPPPTSNLSQLISSFQAVGLSVRDMVALSGAHTVGSARCTNFRERIYNETNINRAFAARYQQSCPRTAGSGDGNLAPLDLQTPAIFDNSYYRDLITQRGLLHSDQQLFNGGPTDSMVRMYSNIPSSFNSDFASAMNKMGGINPLTGNNGEIRRNCRRVN